MLAKASAHSTSPQADPPLSRASSLPQKIAGAHNTWIQHQTLWERACSRRRRHIQHHHKQTHRYREQAQLPQGFVANAGPLITPAPLWERACSRRRRHIQHQCKLIHHYREQARSHNGLRAPSASGFNTKPCGASLLAKTPAHPTSPQADPPLSRASSAPTGICGERRPPDHPGPLWERACSRRRRHIQHLCKLTHRYREQARSHKELRLPTASGFNTKPCDSYSSTGVGQPRQRVRDGLRALCGAFGGAA